MKPMADIPDLVPGGTCPETDSSAQADMASQAAALIPLKVGLVLSSLWKGDDDYEHECLTQITEVTQNSVVVKKSCPVGKKRVLNRSTRRLCRSDFVNSYLYIAEESEDFPEAFGGALAFSLSEASFSSLKNQGATRHRFIDLDGHPLKVDADIDGVLRREDTGTFKIIINDKSVEVPTIEASHVNNEKHELIKVKVLDDPRFPLMLDYWMPFRHFFITYTKISYPTDGEMERHLAIDKHVDVYGIYFDFASDRVRLESTPVLAEIAGVLAKNADWKLSITGHTDNVGGDASNLELSRRRALAVKAALVERYAVAGGRGESHACERCRSFSDHRSGGARRRSGRRGAR